MARLQPGGAARRRARATAQLLARCELSCARARHSVADRARPCPARPQRPRRIRSASPIPGRGPARVAGRRRDDYRCDRAGMCARAARGGRATNRRADPGPRAMSEEDKSKLQQPSAKDKRGDWERRQSASGPPRAPEPSVVEMLDLLPRGLALDLAASTGRHSLLLAHAGFKVVAIDYAETAMRKLQWIARAEDLYVWPLAADLSVFPLP